MENKTFNTIITGVGGQGLITLLKIISQAALDSGLSPRTSELHGLSQRGGSVKVHIRFGKKVYSPVIAKAEADLVIALEYQETLAGIEFSSNSTAFLVNKYQTPTLGKTVAFTQVEKELKKISKEVIIIPAFDICQKELGRSVVAGIFLLGLAYERGLLPLSELALIKAIKKTVPKKYEELNIKAFQIAKKYAKT